MRLHIPVLFVLLGAAAAGTGCATAEQWAEWREHSSHFASGDHLLFSLRNQGTTPKVRQSDVQNAQSQSWWGDPVVVRPEQLFSS